MEPKKFPGANTTFAKDQPEYKPLPAFVDKGPMGEVVTCWKLTFRERLRVLFKGEIWLVICSFHQPLSPSLLSTKKEDVIETKK